MSRTRALPTPTKSSTNSEPEIWKKGTLASPETARANRVLPQPGGPMSRTPLGIFAPISINFLGFFRKSTTSSNSSSQANQPIDTHGFNVGDTVVYNGANKDDKGKQAIIKSLSSGSVSIKFADGYVHDGAYYQSLTKVNGAPIQTNTPTGPLKVHDKVKIKGHSYKYGKYAGKTGPIVSIDGSFAKVKFNAKGPAAKVGLSWLELANSPVSPTQVPTANVSGDIKKGDWVECVDSDGNDYIQVGKKYGTMIGTESTQKIGFYGITPVVQQAVPTIASGSSASDGTARAGVNAIITALIAVGIIKA